MKHKLTGVIFTTAMVLFLLTGVTLTAAAEDPSAWNGTDIDMAWYRADQTNFDISTPAELAGLAAIVNNSVSANRDDFSGKTVTLTANLDLGGHAWTPIGSDYERMAFSGTFEGNSYTITGLYITGDVNYGGLFGCVGSGGTVKNLTVGGVAGTVSGSLVSNCYYLLSAAQRGVGNGAEYDEGGQFEGEVAAICAMEFATQDTFQPEAGVCWDFDVVWEIGTLDGSGAPIRPILQAIPEKLEEDLGDTEIGCFIDYSGDDCGCTRNCSCRIGKYRIFICDNVTATIDGARVIAAEKDQIVTLTITPEDGYQLIAGSLRVTQESNVEEVTVTPESDGTYTFTMPQNIVHVWADFEKIPTVEPAEHEHRWAGGWSGNATHHWHECGNTDCTVTDNSQKDGYAAHNKACCCRGCL